MTRRSRMLVLIGVVGLTSVAVAADAPGTDGAASGAGDLYARITDAYMHGKWDPLEKALRAPAAQMASLTAQQRLDAVYVRQALAECRPSWWKMCAATSKAMIRPKIWDRTFDVIYESGEQSGLKFKTTNRQLSVTVSWDPAALQDTSPAEGSMGKHGFTKADMANLNVWSILGHSASWVKMPPKALAAMSKSEKVRLQQYQDFRANLAGLYYGSPPARRAALVIYLAAFLPKYGSGPMGGSRRAVGSMFLAEVLADPSKWPSLRLPAKLSEDGAEEKLAVHFKFKIGPPWTIAEDKALREAIRAMARKNDRQVLQAGQVVLQNGLVFMIDEAADQPFRAKRDAWVKAQFDKAKGG